MEASDIIASHVPSEGSSLSVNQRYPQELQPRDRSGRVSMAMQIQQMYKKLRPADLGASRNVNQGAPVVRSDGVVLNGNGRSIALHAAYNIDGYNYFKLRDLAALLSSTGSRFSVDFDAGVYAVTARSRAEYTFVGGERELGEDQSATAVPSRWLFYADGVLRPCAAANIGGNNYFKLRDLACILSGTAWQYDVGYDSASRTVTITTGQGYTPLDTDMAVGADASATCVVSNQSVMVNGETVSILAYNIGGDNYVQLRDLADYVGYGVGYDSSTRTVLITTK